MNALCVREDGGIFDPHGIGKKLLQQDLKAACIGPCVR